MSHASKLATLMAACALAACVLATGCAAAQQEAATATAPAPSQEAAADASGQAGTVAAEDAADAQSGAAQSAGEPSGSESGEPAAGAFASWNPESESLAKLVAFVEAATDEGGPGYIAPEDRIATFDMDGTLISEKAPVYVDYAIMLYRVLDDPTYEAPANIVEDCKAIREYAEQGVVNPDYNAAKNADFAQVFAGMTSDEFDEYVNAFLDTQEVRGFSGMTYGESLYRPMVEVVDYLRANGFEVYVVSASERETVRAFVESRLDIRPDHVIGSDLGMASTRQNGEDPANYTFEQGEELVFDGEVLEENGKTGKVISIEREIGKRPVIAFGNSTGDFAMLNYAMGNGENPGCAFLVVADDAEREYGDEAQAADMRESAAAEGWTVFSMRDDWTTIYGDHVKRTGL